MKKLWFATILVLTSSFALASSPMTDIEAAFLAGVKLGQEKEFEAEWFVLSDGYVKVQAKKGSFVIKMYDGYDCDATISLKEEDDRALIRNAELRCY